MTDYQFMIEHLHSAIIWFIVTIVAWFVFPRLGRIVSHIPILGAVTSVPLIMLTFHSFVVSYFFLQIVGLTEKTTLIILGVVSLLVLMRVSWILAADDVRKGNYGL